MDHNPVLSFIAQIVLALAIRNVFKLTPMFFHYAPVNFQVPWDVIDLLFSLSQPQINYFSKEPCSLLLKNNI